MRFVKLWAFSDQEHLAVQNLLLFTNVNNLIY